MPSGHADSLGLPSGVFGAPVVIGEADAQYEGEGFRCRLLGVIISIPRAGDINRVYGNNTPKSAYGMYAELGYNILFKTGGTDEEQLIVFVRYERLNMNASIPENGIFDGTLNQHHVIGGFTYLPINNVVVKADVRFSNSGDFNPALLSSPPPGASVYATSDTFLNFGIGFSF